MGPKQPDLNTTPLPHGGLGRLFGFYTEHTSDSLPHAPSAVATLTTRTSGYLLASTGSVRNFLPRWRRRNAAGSTSPIGPKYEHHSSEIGCEPTVR